MKANRCFLCRINRTRQGQRWHNGRESELDPELRFAAQMYIVYRLFLTIEPKGYGGEDAWRWITNSCRILEVLVEESHQAYSRIGVKVP